MLKYPKNRSSSHLFWLLTLAYLFVACSELEDDSPLEVEVPPEKPNRFRLQVYRALSGELIGEHEGEQLLNDTFESSSPQSLTQHRAFLELPKDLRRRILREQAEQMVEHYEQDSEWRELGGGDIVEY